MNAHHLLQASTPLPSPPSPTNTRLTNPTSPFPLPKNKTMTEPKLQTLSLSCSCGTVQHTFTLPRSSLPLPTNLCSCDISRRISGSLLTSYINITHPTPTNPKPPKPNLENCTAYHSSEILKRWFCSTCGTHMYLEYAADGHFEAATGTLVGGEGEGRRRSSDGVVEWRSCMWIEDTVDGGASEFITHIDGSGKELERWTREPGDDEEVPLNWRAPCSSEEEEKEEKGEEGEATKPVYAHCHCRGVEFWITPPNDASSKTAKSPWPDLIIPHHANKSANPDNYPWWIIPPSSSRPSNSSGKRFLAGTCACTSCRLASGFDITFWAFIPTANIFLDADLKVPFASPSSSSQSSSSSSPAPAYWGTMTPYSSSKGVTRTFCSTCGANVFWNGDEEIFGRVGLVDVAVGLLDAESGARAEELLAWWTGRVSFSEVEERGNRGLVQGLERGLREWAGRNEGRVCVAKFDREVVPKEFV